MSLSKWKELAQRKTKAGKVVKELYDEITMEQIRSKTTDQAIAKTFRLDKLDKLDQIAEQTKPRQRGRVPRPRINLDGGIGYAPEVDPYEDMDVEGLLNLEDYVPPQAEKQIAKKPPQYQMDPSFWQIPDEPPPPYDEEEEEEEQQQQQQQLALESPPEEDKANQLLDQLELPNYDDVEKRLAEREMNHERRQKYLQTVYKNAETRRKQVAVMKTHASNKSKKGEITEEERNQIYKESNRLQSPIIKFKNKMKQKMKSFKGKGIQRGRGVVFYNNPQELLEKFAVILGEMEAGNSSIKMRNMGQTILDTLLKNKRINKSQYQKIVKKYFPL